MFFVFRDVSFYDIISIEDKLDKLIRHIRYATYLLDVSTYP